jgi:hypothetical protein
VPTSPPLEWHLVWSPCGLPSCRCSLDGRREPRSIVASAKTSIDAAGWSDTFCIQAADRIRSTPLPPPPDPLKEGAW